MVLICVLLAFLCGPAVSHAADVKVGWKASEGVSGYRVEISTDNGATWGGAKDTGPVAPSQEGDVSFTYTEVPETGLVLFGFTAYNDSHVAIRTEAGVWYNHRWKPIPTPSVLGIE